ncbi:DUF427 domain-containing protein [Alphaproteobacteria bacterium]|nr:DUF427 domain-containing protein [Alphaproteobacteria bacterium]
MNKNNIYLTRYLKRITAKFNNIFLVDSINTLILDEKNHDPVYYFPREDIKTEYLLKTNHKTHCPFKGDASYWNIKVSDKEVLNAAWSYENPIPEQAEIKNLIAFYWDYIDEWYEDSNLIVR